MSEASETGGVKPFPIAGRVVIERERLRGMTSEERDWRKQYLKDFKLKQGPLPVLALEMELSNPIRRAYRMPLDKLQDCLMPKLGFQRAHAVRFWMGKFFLCVAGIYAGAYYLKYNANDWTTKGGWRIKYSRIACLPGDADYPKTSDRVVPSDYNSRGFKEYITSITPPDPDPKGKKKKKKPAEGTDKAAAAPAAAGEKPPAKVEAKESANAPQQN